MKNTKSHNKFFRNTLLLLLVLFSLTPCSVKESGALAFGVEYQRPFNKTRAFVSHIDSCDNLVFNQVDSVKTQDLFELDFLANTPNNTFLFLSDINDGYLKTKSKKSSDLGQPLYILYSRLKLDIA